MQYMDCELFCKGFEKKRLRIEYLNERQDRRERLRTTDALAFFCYRTLGQHIPPSLQQTE
jgi:hypothetical protein